MQRSQSARGSVRPPRPQRPNFAPRGGRGQTDYQVQDRHDPSASWLRVGDWGKGGGPTRIWLQARRGRGLSPTRECARQSGSARQTDKPAGCQPCRLLAPTSLASLSVCPSTPPLVPSHFSSLHLSPCQVGTVFRAYTAPKHARTHGRTQILPNLATVSHHISRGDTISPAQPHRHTPLWCRLIGVGAVWKGSLSSRPLQGPTSQGCLFSLRLWGEDAEAKGAQT